jgi:HSP20 family protein
MRSSISRWVPIKRLAEMESAFDRLFPVSRRVKRALTGAIEWSPAVDIYEKNESIIVKAEIPGINLKNLHVTVEKDVLTISGERRDEEEVREENFFKREREFGPFSRDIILPTAVDKEKVNASLKDGILAVELQKSGEFLKHEIEIEIQ